MEDDLVHRLEDGARTWHSCAAMSSLLEEAAAEIKRLRFRLNHQTEDDVAACEQGKHPPDCGA